MERMDFKKERQKLLDNLNEQKSRARLYKELYEETYELSQAKKTSSYENHIPRIQIKTPEEENLKSITETCESNKNKIETNQHLFKLISHVADDKPIDESFNQLLLSVNQNINNQKATINTKIAQIKEAKEIAKRYKEELERPTTIETSNYSKHTLKLLEPRSILSVIKPFNPDLEENVDFSQTWRYIMSYTKSEQLTEQSYIYILGVTLKGQAHKIVHEMSMNDSSLDEILTTLSNLYCTKRTIKDDIDEIGNFKRPPKENIERTMTRARILVEKTKHLSPADSWNDQYEILMISIIKQVISKATRQHIENEQRKLLKIGIILDYESILDMVETFEADNDETPTETIATTVNAYSRVPTSLDTNFSNQENNINDKIKDLKNMVINLNALRTENERSNRTSSHRESSSSRSTSSNRSDSETRKEFTRRQAWPEEHHRENKESRNRRSYEKMNQSPDRSYKRSPERYIASPDRSYKRYVRSQENDIASPDRSYKRYVRSQENDIASPDRSYKRYVRSQEKDITSPDRSYERDTSPPEIFHENIDRSPERSYRIYFTSHDRFYEQKQPNGSCEKSHSSPDTNEKPPKRNKHENNESNFNQNRSLSRDSLDEKHIDNNQNRTSTEVEDNPNKTVRQLQNCEYTFHGITLKQIAEAIKKAGDPMQVKGPIVITPQKPSPNTKEFPTLTKTQKWSKNLMGENDENSNHQEHLKSQYLKNEENINKYTSTIMKKSEVTTPEISCNEIDIEKYEEQTIKTTIRSIHIHGKVKLNYTDENGSKPKEDCKQIDTEMLLDTGCMVTTISTKMYERLNPDYKEKDLFQKTKMTLKNCHNKISPLKGITTINIQFSKYFSINIKVLISDQLSQDFILGFDFIGSELVKSLKSNTLTLTKKHHGKHIRIPLIFKNIPPIACLSTHSVVIEPFCSAAIQFQLKNLKSINTNQFQFTNSRSKINNLEFLPTAYNFDNKSNLFTLPVINNSCHEILIEKDVELSRIEILNENEIECVTLDANRMEIYEMTPDNNLEANNTILDAKESIKQQKAFNKKEQQDAEENLRKDGYFQPSVTDYIKQKSSITDLGLEDETIPTRDEFLKQFNISNLSEDHKKMAEEIFERNSKAFAMHQYDIGKTDLIKMNIKVTNQSPRMQKFIPIPMNAKHKVKEILDQLKKHDIIRECNEPSNYCSNILVIKKRDGQSIRLLFDGRLLNYDTPRLPMATTSKLEILSHLVNKKHLSSMDLADAFFHIELDEESQPLTAFYSSVHSQRFCFKRAPQGLRNSPLYLKLLLDKIFADMHESCILFFDDLLIATDGTLEEHLQIVDEVLKRIAKAGLKLRPKKLNIAKKQIEFLGMIFEKGKLSIPDAKLEAFRKLPSPTTPKKAKSLICALSYYRHFVPNFAKLSKEIMDLGSIHPKMFKWTKEHEEKLRKLISSVCENSKLYLPDPTKRFYVQTDSSQNCAGGRVFQKDKYGNELLIAAVSRTYSKTERGYSIFKKEILALMYTLKTMDYFLRFADKLTILTDAKGIIYLRLAKDSSGIILRFSLELSKYNATISHVSGEENIISDVLSRHNDGIDNILKGNFNEKPLSEKESVKFVKKLTLPHDFKLTPEEVRILLEGQSPALKTKQSKRKSKAQEGPRKIKNTPATLTNKKINLPRVSMRRPGIVMKKKRNPQRRQKFSVDVNVMTRAQKKSVDQKDKEEEETNTERTPTSTNKKKKVTFSEEVTTYENMDSPNNENDNRAQTKTNYDANEAQEEDLDINTDTNRDKEVIKMSDILRELDETDEEIILPSTSKTVRKSSRKSKMTERMKDYLEEQKENPPANKIKIASKQQNPPERLKISQPLAHKTSKVNPFIEEDENEEVQEANQLSDIPNDANQFSDNPNDANQFSNYPNDANQFSDNPNDANQPSDNPNDSNQDTNEEDVFHDTIEEEFHNSITDENDNPEDEYHDIPEDQFHDTLEDFHDIIEEPFEEDNVMRQHQQDEPEDEFVQENVPEENKTTQKKPANEEPANNENIAQNGNPNNVTEETPDIITYTDVENLTNFIKDGLISIKQFIKAQQNDEFCLNILEAARNKGFDKIGYEIINGVIFRKYRNIIKPVLPNVLIDVIINTKHFSIYGAHASPTRISRDIQQQFYIPRNTLLEKLKQVTNTCYICQIFKDEIKGHKFSSLPKPSKPRQSWSMDIMSNLPKTSNDNCQILLLVDDFTSFVVCVPLKDSTSKSIIEAIKSHIFSPFGIPKIIRSDEQASFYNSQEFFQFMTDFNIKLTATAVASPFSNARAESQIKNIKKLARKFLYQEHSLEKWDSYIHILTMVHNSSTGIYGYSAEKLMFGTKNTNPNVDLLEFDWTNNDESTFINNIFQITEKERQKALKRMKLKSNQNKTFKNAKRALKKFLPGSLVLQRQLQVSTGKGSDYKPKFTGPYIILSLNNDDSSAFVEHIKDGSISKAHFNNLQLLHFTPRRLPFNKKITDNLSILLDEHKTSKNPPTLKTKKKTK